MRHSFQSTRQRANNDIKSNPKIDTLEERMNHLSLPGNINTEVKNSNQLNGDSKSFNFTANLAEPQLIKSKPADLTTQ
jgi:hypothetical protein